MSWENKIIDYLNNELSDEERQQIESLMKEDVEMQKTLESYQELFGFIDRQHLEEPSVESKFRLEKIIAAYDSKSAKVVTLRSSNIWKYIIGIAAVLLIGFLIGTNYEQKSQLNVMDQQIASLHNRMLEQLESPSVSKRIEGIQVSQLVKNDDPIPIVETLLHTLEKDVSPNVRLAATEALVTYMQDERVRSSLIGQLKKEQDAFVLIAIIEALSSYGDKNAVNSLKELSNSESTPKYVKDQALWGIIKLEEI